MKDWRIVNQEKYLSDVTLVKAKFARLDDENDHTHCAFCWEKFSERPGDLHIGYATLDGYYWICECCFDDFEEQFHWTIQK